MSKLDEALDVFNNMRDELTTARERIGNIDDKIKGADARLADARVQAEQIVSSAENAVAELLQEREQAHEDIEREKRRLRVAGDKLKNLIPGFIAGTCGKDERADIEKALEDDGAVGESVA